ncbi:UDP-N-acetylglucosamine 2-epimerase (hydrolyzing) [Xenorhabdus sp. DI]|uniref:UDP-N-acetylglucosamine 2-epimerase n=1 Tax=Xenorhabdus doucetiae TaxID=351671 RepID=UPI0019C62085|nr:MULTISPECIES: UDP-N-acetylglucosamine 2-epimerase [unclassified Xenorhabdus]MBD2785780.1 UDP-N-acetylglucosamine 2-epimerase (hydrolyzing) [Xenorhabdus sp. 3]MBD2789169.1 UDP-N-acetylglucosamine 2-epimerase (hydrolyzing) [Xenorhabdus sp. DI]
MKKILYVTGSRAEYGIMKRLLVEMREDSDINLSIIATGMHCDENYGLTYKNIENDGFEIEKLISINIDTKNNATILKTMSNCMYEFGNYFQTHCYDAIILLGDRYEIFSVASAAAMHNLPIIHLHGGEQTLGNYDEFIRHSITKMSRLHLASTEEYRNRIIQMGECPSTVFNIGALGAENSLSMLLPSREVLENKFGSLSKDYFMVVFHPETLTTTPLIDQVMELLSALVEFTKRYDFIFIGSNSDTGSNEISAEITKFCKKTNSRYLKSVTPEEYLSFNLYSKGLIGNSSSGLIEIPTLKVPTINVGDRQKGRVRGCSVIDTKCNRNDIINAINKSQSHEFIGIVAESINPYLKKDSLKMAINIIKEFLWNDQSNYKKFYDL